MPNILIKGITVVELGTKVHFFSPKQKKYDTKACFDIFLT
jgi:hypothetical protein